MPNSLYDVTGATDVNTFNASLNNPVQVNIQSSAPRILSSSSAQASPYISPSRQTYQPNTFGLNSLFTNLGTEAGNALVHLFGGDTNKDLAYQTAQVDKMASKGFTLTTDDNGNKQFVNDKGDVEPFKAYDDSKPFGERIIPQGTNNIIGQQIFDGIMAYKMARWQGADRGNASSAMVKSMMYEPQKPNYKWNTQVDKDGNLMAYTVTGTKYDAQGNPLPAISTGDTGIDVKQKEGTAPKVYSLTRDGAGNLFKINALTGDVSSVEGSQGKPTKADKDTGYKTFTDAQGKVFAWNPKDPETKPVLLSDVTKPQSATIVKANAAAVDKQKEVVNNAEDSIDKLIAAANNPHLYSAVGSTQGSDLYASVMKHLNKNYEKANNQLKFLMKSEMQIATAVQGKNFSDADRKYVADNADFSPTSPDSEMRRRLNANTYYQSKIAYDANRTEFMKKHGFAIVNNSKNDADGKFEIQIVQDDGSLSSPVRVEAKDLAKIDVGYQGLGLLNIPTEQPKQATQPKQYTEGMTATNPSTGQRVVYRNGSWEAL